MYLQNCKSSVGTTFSETSDGLSKGMHLTLASLLLDASLLQLLLLLRVSLLKQQSAVRKSHTLKHHEGPGAV